MNKEFLGYHGTLKKHDKSIRKSGFRKSNSGWLGEGVYFFQEDFELALLWAKKKYNTQHVVAIKNNIKATEKNLLDISYPLSNQSKYYHSEREKFILMMKNRGYEVCLESRKRYENQLINLICEKKGYEVVRACTYTYQKYDYINGNEIDSKFANGIELSVRNLDCID